MSAGDMTIVGGGWSVQNVAIDHLAGLVIAVNDSALHLPRWDYAVSMDRLWTEARWPTMLDKLAVDPKRELWLRRSAVQNIPEAENLAAVHVFDCDHKSSKFSRELETLNGTNSGACALNLAYLYKPTRLFLLGFDMNRDRRGMAYWYPPYPWTSAKGGTSNGKYSDWAREFYLAASEFLRAGVKVFNVSPASAIDAFDKITPAEYMRLTA